MKAKTIRLEKRNLDGSYSFVRFITDDEIISLNEFESGTKLRFSVVTENDFTTDLTQNINRDYKVISKGDSINYANSMFNEK